MAFYLTSILTFYLAFSSVEEVDKKGTREESTEGKFRALLLGVFGVYRQLYKPLATSPIARLTALFYLAYEHCDLALAVEQQNHSDHIKYLWVETQLPSNINKKTT